MGIISWIILGLIAGFVGSKIVDKQGQGFWLKQQSGAYTQCRFPLSEAKRKCRTLIVTSFDDPSATFAVRRFCGANRAIALPDPAPSCRPQAF